MYDEGVHQGLQRCQFNPDGPECLNPEKCLCRQIFKAVPSGINKSSSARWSSIVDDDETTETRIAATQILGKRKRERESAQSTCNIHLNHASARPQNEWTEKQIIMSELCGRESSHISSIIFEHNRKTSIL